MNLSINFSQFVQINHTEAVTNSKFVAQAFGKRHDHVLAKISELKAEIPSSFHIPNFREMEIETEIGLGKTRKARAYQLTKDGFMLLVMGFTGKAAMQIKIAYIEAFNAMADKLKQLAEPAETKINPAQKQQIREAVQQRHHRTGEHWQDIYRKLHNLLQVNSYHEITAEQFQTAMAFLSSIQNTPAKAEPQPKPMNESLLCSIAHVLLHAQDMRRFIGRYLTAFENLGIDGKGALYSFVYDTRGAFDRVRAFVLPQLADKNRNWEYPKHPIHLRQRINDTANV